MHCSGAEGCGRQLRGSYLAVLAHIAASEGVRFGKENVFSMQWEGLELEQPV